MTIHQRVSGILLHISSLPSRFGIGDLGPKNRRFVDLLAEAKQRCWSVLPLNPTSPEEGNSPYKTRSAFAGNPLFVSPELLVEEGLLTKNEVERWEMPSQNRVNYPAVYPSKDVMFKKAYLGFKKSKNHTLLGAFDFDSFCEENAGWLDDWALFEAARKKTGVPWHLWPANLRNREVSALTNKRLSLKDEVGLERFVQFAFFSQWQALKAYCAKNEVKILGDLPFYVAYESVDVWVHPELFKLTKTKAPQYVAGVPPDYFSRTGQLWGTPIYDWQNLKKNRFEWWTTRIAHNLNLCDLLRFDHFRGFVAYWQVPAGAKTAKAGCWIRAPSKSFLKTVQECFPGLPFVAEDLGAITLPVRETLRRLGIPGMRVLLFGFDDSKTNPNLPRNLAENAMVYTGTHDTNTIKGWYQQEATQKQKTAITKYLGREISAQEACPEFTRLALASKAKLCIIPMQDVLCLGSEARMNCPALQSGNWEWRVTAEQLASEKLKHLRELVLESNRS